MKKFLLVLSVCLLPVLGLAGDKADIEINIVNDNPSGLSAVFGGAVYDFDNGLSLKAGGVTKMWGNLYSFTHVNAGSYGSFDQDLGYFFHKEVIGLNCNFGLLAGPNADWINIPDGQPAILYMVGAGGGILAVDVTDAVGLWTMAKYKFALEDNNYEDGIVLGGGLYLRF